MSYRRASAGWPMGIDFHQPALSSFKLGLGFNAGQHQKVKSPAGQTGPSACSGLGGLVKDALTQMKPARAKHPGNPKTESESRPSFKHTEVDAMGDISAPTATAFNTMLAGIDVSEVLKYLDCYGELFLCVCSLQHGRVYDST